jgi:hypothetical protein
VECAEGSPLKSCCPMLPPSGNPSTPLALLPLPPSSRIATVRNRRCGVAWRGVTSERCVAVTWQPSEAAGPVRRGIGWPKAGLRDACLRACVTTPRLRCAPASRRARRRHLRCCAGGTHACPRCSRCGRSARRGGCARGGLRVACPRARGCLRCPSGWDRTSPKAHRAQRPWCGCYCPARWG